MGWRYATCWWLPDAFTSDQCVLLLQFLHLYIVKSCNSSFTVGQYSRVQMKMKEKLHAWWRLVSAQNPMEERRKSFKYIWALLPIRVSNKYGKNSPVIVFDGYIGPPTIKMSQLKRTKTVSSQVIFQMIWNKTIVVRNYNLSQHKNLLDYTHWFEMYDLLSIP